MLDGFCGVTHMRWVCLAYAQDKILLDGMWKTEEG